MGEDSKLAWRIKRQLDGFAGRLTEGVGKVKQTYHIEDVRLRSYVGLRNPASSGMFVHAVAYFVSVVIGWGARLRFLFRTICEKAQRFFEIARFYHYAVADGIRTPTSVSHGETPRIPAS